jgi:hypothetical protein
VRALGIAIYELALCAAVAIDLGLLFAIKAHVNFSC